MFCSKCGKEIKEGEKFCRSCGTPVKQKNQEEKPKKAKVVKKEPVVNKVVPETNQEYTQPIQPEKQKKSGGKGVIIGILVALIVAVIGASVVYVMFLSEKNIDALANAELVFEGYDGVGSASILIDGDTVDNPEESLREYIEEASEEAHGIIPFVDPIVDIFKGGSNSRKFEKALESITYSFEMKDEDKGLDEISNGDVVVLKIEYDEDAFKAAGYRLINTSKEFTADGLLDADQIDPFTYIELTWRTNSKGKFHIVAEINDDSPVEDFSCEISDPDENGDVEVKIDKDEFADYGYKPIKTSKTMHVGDEPERLDELTDENRDQVEELAAYILNEYYVKKCGSNLYVGDNIELIDYPTEKNIKSISVSHGVVYVEFDVSTEEGKHHFNKSFSFDCYIDSEGKPICTTEIKKESLGCAIKGKTWSEY